MEDAIRAMECLMADPDLHGLLIKGPAGSGKSALIHSFSEAITGRRAKVVPQNITDEQLFGTIDLEEAFTTGKTTFEPGLLGGDGGILLVDDINLLPKTTALTMMDSVAKRHVHIEREGLSVTYPCRMKIIATANDREQPIASNVADLFDMCVVIPRDPNVKVRLSVMSSVMEEENDEIDADQELIDRISKATEIIPSIDIPDDALKAIVATEDRYGAQGARGGLSAAKVCRASAAMKEHDKVEEDDISFAIKVCIPHRRTRIRRDTAEKEDQVQFFGDSHMKRFIHDDRTQTPEKETEPSEEKPNDPTAEIVNPEDVVAAGENGIEEPLVLDMDKLFETIDLLDDSRKKKGQTDNKLMRKYIKNAGKDGRYVSSRPANDSTDDLAIDATVRYAAPYQKHRREQTGREGIIVMPSDLRQKVREKHTSCLFFFMVDNSGSLVIRARMRAVKAAIMSMLGDHYVRKDSVAVMTFNEEFVGMLLPPTRSVGGVKKVVDDIPTGMKTPLSEALVFMHQYIGQYLRKNPQDMAFVVLMTDAGANLAMEPGADPLEEALQIASTIRLDRMECVVVDTKVSNERNEKALKLSYALLAPYYKIEDLRSSDNILR